MSARPMPPPMRRWIEVAPGALRHSRPAEHSVGPRPPLAFVPVFGSRPPCCRTNPSPAPTPCCVPSPRAQGSRGGQHPLAGFKSRRRWAGSRAGCATEFLAARRSMGPAYGPGMQVRAAGPIAESLPRSTPGDGPARPRCAPATPALAHPGQGRRGRFASPSASRYRSLRRRWRATGSRPPAEGASGRLERARARASCRPAAGWGHRPGRSWAGRRSSPPGVESPGRPRRTTWPSSI